MSQSAANFSATRTRLPNFRSRWSSITCGPTKRLMATSSNHTAKGNSRLTSKREFPFAVWFELVAINLFVGPHVIDDHLDRKLGSLVRVAEKLAADCDI